MKKKTALFLCLVMLLSLFPAGEHAHANDMYDDWVMFSLQPSTRGHGETFEPKFSYRNDLIGVRITVASAYISGSGITATDPSASGSVDLARYQSVSIYFRPFMVNANATADTYTVTMTAKVEPLVDGVPTGAYYMLTPRSATLTVRHDYVLQSDGASTHSMVCSCGRVDSTVAHAWNSGTQITAPSCIFPGTDGSMLYTCTVCGETKTEAIPWAHTWGAWVNNGDGNHVRECSVCRTQDWQACTYDSGVVSPPTCEAAGHTTYTCTLCGYHIFTEYTNPLNHDWGAWVSNGDGTHTRTCFNDPAHKQTAPCTYDSVVTPPTCTEDGYTNHTCSACGHSFTDTPTGALDHDWGIWVSNGDGTHTRTCLNDPAHTQTEPCAYDSVVTSPTCTEDGYTNHTCSACGHSFTDTPTGALDHDWGVWVSNGDGTHTHTCLNDPAHTETEPCAYDSVVTPPTCTEGGYTTHTCTAVACGYSYTDTPTGALDHDWGSWVSNGDGTHTHTCLNDPAHTQTEPCAYDSAVTPPTCTEGGYTTHTCTAVACGFSYTNTPTGALDHDWDAWASNGDGTHTRTCANDPAHTQTEPCAYDSVITPPTCTEGGYTTHTCTAVACGFSYTDTPTGALDHDWGAWVSNGDGTHTHTCLNDPAHTQTEPCAYDSVVTPPTCTEGGYTTHTCTAVACGFSYTNTPTGALDHDWGAWASNGDGTHTRTCANDPAHTQTEPCAYDSAVTPPTCEADGFTTHTCTVCRHSFTDTPTGATGHTPVTDPAVPPTCTLTGLTEGSHCSECTGVLVAQQTVAATGHTPVTDPAVPPTCTLTGLTEGSHCSECTGVLIAQQTVDATGHTPVTDPAVPPTCTLTGLTEGSHCSECAAVLVAQQTVAATKHDWGAWTLNGDGTHSRVCLNDPSHTQTLDFSLPDVRILKVETIGASTLRVSWNGRPEADGYEVWYGTAAAGPYRLAKVTGDTAYSKTYLRPGVRYFFMVRAYIMEDDARVCGAFSAPVAGVPLAKAVIIKTSSVSTSQIKLTWKKVDGATGYEVFRSRSKTGTYAAIRKINALSMTVTGMKPGNTYYFKVRAYKKINTTYYFGPISAYRSGRTLTK